MLVLLAGVVAFGAIAPPERCPSVSADDLRASAEAAAGWFVRNQQPDGTWLYLYESDTDTAPVDYNVVRHAGVLMSLYQAASFEIPGALASADEGLDWIMSRVRDTDGGAAAVTYRGQTPVGTTALLVAGLVERREATGETDHDQLLERLGRFLADQTEASGAVLAYADSRTGRPIPGVYSKYYTGEAYWAVARLHRSFPADGWSEVADRIGRYLATERDETEDHWPPIPDHWAAYGLAETVAFEERTDHDRGPLTADEVDYARRQAESFGAQVRWVSQRFGPWGLLVRTPHVPRGGGYGVVGEALTGLWRVAQDEPRLADLRGPLAERARCVAGLAVEVQVDEDEAGEDYPDPDRAEGAWFRDDSTRMDDQQHALSALLRTIAIVEAEAASSDDDDERPAPSAWLWLLALLAALNPTRLAFGIPRPEPEAPDPSARWRGVAGIAALGGGVGAASVLVVALAGGALIGAIDVSDPALRIAAGSIAAAVGLVELVSRPPSPQPALPGWRAALVPVAVPLVAGPALVMLAISARADRGLGLVALALVLGVGLLTVAAVSLPSAGPGRRLMAWAGRLTAAVLAATSILLVIDGVFDV